MLYLWAAPFFLFALACLVFVTRTRGGGRAASLLFFSFSALALGTVLLAAFTGGL
jgi:hypothetical protein